ncbi:MAG: type IVB secretion system protein DotA [Tatlockia sp.]|jgi:defect-in-organelle-trafficking protein DotA
MIKKIAWCLLSLVVPTLALASSDSSLSFTPPPSDLSVVFLGDIFGIVDGVLHGTGSQMLGNIFGVFNSAVLALGGIIIMYTLIVSTMNTAQEGQMLGQKWSSIWVPLRATLGLALLIPKASGYCLMQIFVMWIVVQGVGAADKVWGAALSYLNRGGLIVQTQMNPATSLISGGSSVASAASTILAGQVCMVGLQTVLETERQNLINSAQSGSGACAGTPSKTMQVFCANQVPNFLSTVNTVAVQNANPDSTQNYSVKMPNFDDDSPYATLNGICGTITWSPFSASSISTVQQTLTNVNSTELQTAKMSRAIAIQQMYIDLSSVAEVMVNNDPAINPNKSTNTGTTTQNTNYSPIAVEQFGVPYLTSGTACSLVTPTCMMWGRDPLSTNTSSPIFGGTEFQGAIADYNGIMLPTLNLFSQATSNQGANNQRAFIDQANAQGWILAGSYFFDLALLNSAAINNANLTDTNTGLSGSTFDPSLPLSPFGSGQCTTSPNLCDCSGTYADLCIWLNKSPAQVSQVISLINGNNILDAPLAPPSVNPLAPGYAAKTGIQSSTVYGFVNNSLMISLPGQPGLNPPQFAMKFNISINLGQFELQKQQFPCGNVTIMWFSFCLGSMLGDIFYNLIIRNLFNLFLSILAPFINVVIQSFLAAPLVGISQIFIQGVSIIQQPSVNPVIALANMGVNYINFANELWILLIGLSATPLLIFILPLIILIMPLLLSWLSIMVAIGFTTAYYIPFLPYMIFTFGSIAWLMAVIEAMVAAPIVALGVTHPEGHDAFGKGEQAIMILMNVFLRPSMMIIGFIAGIALSYVSVWVINAGFANAAAFIQGTSSGIQWNYSFTNTMGTGPNAADIANNYGSLNSGYSSWAGIYGFFFSVLIYTTMYLVVVQKAFTLITYLPDKILRWIGGQPEGIGEQAAQWGEEPKKQVEAGGEKTTKASQQRDQQLGGYATKAIGGLKGGGGGGGGGSQVSSKGGGDGESGGDGGGFSGSSTPGAEV